MFVKLGITQKISAIFAGEFGGGGGGGRHSSGKDAMNDSNPSPAHDLSSPEVLRSLARPATPPQKTTTTTFQSKLQAEDGERAEMDEEKPPLPQESWRESLPQLGRKGLARLSSDLVVSCSAARQVALVAQAELGGGRGGSASPGSIAAVTSPGSAGSSSKPPIFPTMDRPSSSAVGGGGLKVSLRKTTVDGGPAFLHAGDTGSVGIGGADPASGANSDSVPAFMKEFAGVVRRRSSAISSFNPNEPAPPRSSLSDMGAAARPHSAILSSRRLSSTHSPDHSSSSSPHVPVPPVQLSRRKSDFLAKYEQLSSRANEALSRVEAMDAHEDSRSPNNSLPMSPEPEDVEFDEEEVLNTCKNFLKDYNNSRRKSLTLVEPTLVVKPRVVRTQEVIFISKPETSFKPTRRVSSSMLGASISVATSPVPSIRNRSSSLTLLDKRAPHIQHHQDGEGAPGEFVLKPILKKSSEELDMIVAAAEHKPIPILKNKDSETMGGGGSGGGTPPPVITGAGSGASVGGILKKKSTDDGQPRPDHIRIRSPSPDSSSRMPRPILRSRNNSTCDERMSSPEPIQSILKRRSSTEDLDLDNPASRSSPEPQGILKRKYSSANTSGSHTPESTDGSGARPISSILKKAGGGGGHGSSSLEDVEFSSERIKSILKKRQMSTDDELEDQGFSSATQQDRPRSILKSRKSEESLSPLSDPNSEAARKSPAIAVATAAATAAAVASSFSAGLDFEPRPILKHKDSREDLMGGGSGGNRSRTLSPSSHE